MKRIIEVTSENRAFLSKAFGVSQRMVFYALAFDSEKGKTVLAEKIRNLALKRGGKVINVMPECETIHDADGMMIQKFENGYEITADKHTGLVRVWKGEKMVDQQYECTIKRFSEMQNCIENGEYDSVVMNTPLHTEFVVAK